MFRFKKPVPREYGDHYGPYLAHLAEDERDVLVILRSQGLAVLEGLKGISDEHADHRYEPDKWSVKELIGHIIDTERLFAFRALWFARGEANPQPGMDENIWAANSNAGARSRKELWQEHHVMRTNHLYLFRSFASEDIARCGEASGATMTVNAVPWIMAAHELHHLQVLRDRYGIDFLGQSAQQERA